MIRRYKCINIYARLVILMALLFTAEHEETQNLKVLV